MGSMNWSRGFVGLKAGGRDQLRLIQIYRGGRSYERWVDKIFILLLKAILRNNLHTEKQIVEKVWH